MPPVLVPSALCLALVEEIQKMFSLPNWYQPPFTQSTLQDLFELVGNAVSSIACHKGFELSFS